MNTRNAEKNNSIKELITSRGFFQIDEYEKDLIAVKIIKCLEGLVIEEALDQLD